MVLDDFFPDLLTGFRVAEYNAYLERDRRLVVASSVPHFERAHAEYAAHYAALAPRVRPFSREQLAGCGFAYMNFLNNAVQFLPALETHRVPFALTLYPGGGFGLDEPESDDKLARVLASDLLTGVLTTQDATARYLRARAPARIGIDALFGIVAHPAYFEAALPRQWFGQTRPTFEVCFVAEKYMPLGRNKGFPEFAAAIAELAPEMHALRVHVVGSFDAEDWRACATLPDTVRFHGRLETRALRTFLHGMDAIVSPNRPFVLHAGNFDGFPTGCCVEASLCGVAMLAADPLDLNGGRWVDGESFVRIEPERDSVCAALRALHRAPECVGRIGRAGREVSRVLFAPDAQIGGRIAWLERMRGAAIA